MTIAANCLAAPYPLDVALENYNRRLTFQSSQNPKICLSIFFFDDNSLLLQTPDRFLEVKPEYFNWFFGYNPRPLVRNPHAKPVFISPYPFTYKVFPDGSISGLPKYYKNEYSNNIWSFLTLAFQVGIDPSFLYPLIEVPYGNF